MEALVREEGNAQKQNVHVLKCLKAQSIRWLDVYVSVNENLASEQSTFSLWYLFHEFHRKITGLLLHLHRSNVRIVRAFQQEDHEWAEKNIKFTIILYTYYQHNGFTNHFYLCATVVVCVASLCLSIPITASIYFASPDPCIFYYILVATVGPIPSPPPFPPHTHTVLSPARTQWWEIMRTETTQYKYHHIEQGLELNGSNAVWRGIASIFTRATVLGPDRIYPSSELSSGLQSSGKGFFHLLALASTYIYTE